MGKTVIPALPFDFVGPFKDGLATVRTPRVVKDEGVYQGKWGFINRQGEAVIPPCYAYAETFCGGLARVNVEGMDLGDSDGGGVVDGKNGYIDRRGPWVWEPTAW